MPCLLAKQEKSRQLSSHLYATQFISPFSNIAMFQNFLYFKGTRSPTPTETIFSTSQFLSLATTVISRCALLVHFNLIFLFTWISFHSMFRNLAATSVSSWCQLFVLIKISFFPLQPFHFVKFASLKSKKNCCKLRVVKLFSVI